MKAFPSISVQILIAVLITVVSVLGVSSIIELNVLNDREAQMLHDRGALTADRLANSLAYPLWNLSREQSERVVLDEITSPDVASIRVYDEHGDLYLGKARGADGVVRNIEPPNTNAPDGPTVVPTPRGATFSYSKPITFRGNGIGRVALEITDDSLQSELGKLRWGIAIKLLVLVVLLSVVLYFALRILVIRPLSTLKSWVENVSERQALMPPSFKRSTEVNSLAGAFGSLSVSLRKKNEELESEDAHLRELNRQMQLEIDERKRTEDALRASEERFVKIFNLSPYRMGIIRMRDGVILHVNDTWLKETGFAREEIINHPYQELDFWLSPETMDQVRQILSDGKPIHAIESHFLTRSGEKRVVLASTEIVELDGEPCGLWATHDITDRKRAEEALQASEKRFSVAFNSSPVMASLSLFEGGRFLAVNDRFVTLSGYSREEAVGHTAIELGLWPDPTDRSKIMEILKRDGRVRAFEAGLRMKNGDYRTILLSIEAIELDGQRCLLHAGNDITARKQAETLLRTSEERLRALSARIHSAREEEGTRIAREIHDELGSALTGLKWDLEKMDKTLAKSGNGSGITTVRGRIGNMTGLIESTIDTVRRISSELRPGILDDLGLVAALQSHAQEFQARTGIVCHWKSSLEQVELNRERATAVFRIFQEILTNVLRHSQAANVYIELRSADARLELVVRDDGRGITESETANTRSLGLLGMKERALLVGGEVNITGEIGKGTTVVVRVPTES
jgi:PAS domain S-box-containing protein